MKRLLIVAFLVAPAAIAAERAQPRVGNAWEPQPAREVGGVLGERLKLWREKRLPRVAADPSLLEPFEGGPGSHAWKASGDGRSGQGESPGSSPLWQGEHIGKWLHAASLAYEQTHDEKLLATLGASVRRLVAAQTENGYLGTYAPEKRFYAPPDADTWRSWDIWTQRYNLYGLLTYERFHPNPAVVRASIRIGDLLLDTYGPGKRDMTQIGTRHGMSSGTLLESMVLLYERTGERRFLEFARHIVRMSEDNPQFHLLSAMLAREDVSGPGDGKAYQLMAVLLGYGELYRSTGEAQWLKAAVNGWENIRAGHLYETGGPWSFAHVKVKNNECFAPPELFDPAHPVEVCSATTWVQLSLQLLRMTGEARYAAEAERAVLNQILAAQSPDGIAWTTHPAANTSSRRYVATVNCCASSGPRALEMFHSHLVGMAGDAVSIASYLPATIEVRARGLMIGIRGDYPFAGRANLTFDAAAPASFAVDFALPSGAKSLRVEVNGRAQKTERQASGFYRVRRLWSPAERIDVVFDFPITAYVHNGRGGKRWVAFMRGPVVLASETPFEFDGSQDPASMIDGDRIKGGPRLAPFYRVGNPEGPVVTYFEIR